MGEDGTTAMFSGTPATAKDDFNGNSAIVCISECLISSYGAPLAQRASYLALHTHLVPDGTVNYDFSVTNSINSLLIASRCIPNGAHTNHY